MELVIFKSKSVVRTPSNNGLSKIYQNKYHQINILSQNFKFVTRYRVLKAV